MSNSENLCESSFPTRTARSEVVSELVSREFVLKRHSYYYDFSLQISQMPVAAPWFLDGVRFVTSCAETRWNTSFTGVRSGAYEL